MRYLFTKDKLRRNNFASGEHRQVLLQALLHNQRTATPFRRHLYETFLRWNPNFSLTRVRNRCILTGRAGSVSRRFRLSRMSFREHALQGHLNGISKSSW